MGEIEGEEKKGRFQNHEAANPLVPERQPDGLFGAYAGPVPPVLPVFCLLRRRGDLRGLPKLYQYGYFQGAAVLHVPGGTAGVFLPVPRGSSAGGFLSDGGGLPAEPPCGVCGLEPGKLPVEKHRSSESCGAGSAVHAACGFPAVPFCGKTGIHVFQQHSYGGNYHRSLSAVFPFSSGIFPT